MCLHCVHLLSLESDVLSQNGYGREVKRGRYDGTQLDAARHEKPKPGTARPMQQCTIEHQAAKCRCMARHGTAKYGVTRHDAATRHGTAEHDAARHGNARHGIARHGPTASKAPARRGRSRGTTSVRVVVPYTTRTRVCTEVHLLRLRLKRSRVRGALSAGEPAHAPLETAHGTAKR